MIASHGLVVPPVTTVQSRPSTTEKLVLAPFHHGAVEPLSKVPLTMCSGGESSAAAGPASPAVPTHRAATASTASAGRRRMFHGMAGRSLQAGYPPVGSLSHPVNDCTSQMNDTEDRTLRTRRSCGGAGHKRGAYSAPPACPPRPEPIPMADLILTNVTKVFDNGVVALDQLSLTAKAGEYLVLLGPSGCGKATALRLIAGLDDPTAGTIQVGHRIVNDLPPAERDLAMVFQNYALYPHMSVYENLVFGVKQRRIDPAEV